MLADIENANLQGALTEGDFDHVVFLHVVRCLCGSAIDGYVWVRILKITRSSLSA